jgi:hypothetical protein
VTGGATPNVAASTTTPTVALAQTPVAGSAGNTGIILAYQQNPAPTVIAQRAAIPGATPIPTSVGGMAATLSVSGPLREAATADLAATVSAKTPGWLNGPASSARSVRSCPSERFWSVVYWDGPQQAIAQAAALCPGVDRFWVYRSGRWYGYSPGDRQSSDPWVVEAGEAVFARVP